VAEELDRRRIRPVQVFEDQPDGLALGGVDQPAQQRVEHALLPRSGREVELRRTLGMWQREQLREQREGLGGASPIRLDSRGELLELRLRRVLTAEVQQAFEVFDQWV
jgi:hypothetical protein